MGDEFKLTYPSPYQSGYKSIFGDQFQLKLDPKLQAEMAALEWRMSLERDRGSWSNPDFYGQELRLMGQPFLPSPSFQVVTLLPPLTPPTLLQPKPTSSPSILPLPGASPGPPQLNPFFIFPRGNGPDTPQPGEASMVLKAIWALPIVKLTLKAVKDDLEANVWNKTTTGQKVLLISHGAMIGAGLVAGIVSDKPTRLWVLDKLNGTEIPVPGADGLSFKIYTQQGRITGGGYMLQSPSGLSLGASTNLRTLPDQSTTRDFNITINFNVLTAFPALNSVF